MSMRTSAVATSVGLVLLAACPFLTGFGPAPADASTRVDAWSAEDKAVLASMSLDRLPAPPLDPSNAVETVPAAAALGKRLFADTRLSSNGAVSCAT